MLWMLGGGGMAQTFGAVVHNIYVAFDCCWLLGVGCCRSHQGHVVWSRMRSRVS